MPYHVPHTTPPRAAPTPPCPHPSLPRPAPRRPTSRMAHVASVSPSLTLPRGKPQPMLLLLPRTSSTCGVRDRARVGGRVASMVM